MNPAVKPLDLPRLVMRRAVWVALLGVLLWGLLGLARMRDDVDEELRGARALALLSERLSMLSQMPDAQALQALRDWQAAGELRHLHLRLMDDQGVLRFEAAPDAQLAWSQQALVRLGGVLFEASPPFTVAWPLPRAGGATWVVSLSSAPESELTEALASLLQGAVLMALAALGMVAVMAWNTRQAFAPLGQLLGAMAGLGHSDVAAGPSAVSRLPPMPVSELETVACALRHLEHALSQAQQQRRLLAQQMLSLQEDERQHLARELHDEFGQRLTALRVQVAWLSRRVQGDPEVGTVLREMSHQCEQVQRDVREVLARLRPLPTAEAGQLPLSQLGELLASLVAAWSRATAGGPRWTLQLQWRDACGLAVDWSAHAADWALSEAVSLALYRISQEALTNVARHAHASQAELSLCVSAGPSGAPLHLAWRVVDDGVGLPPLDDALAQGSGLAGIKQRLWVLGADLRCEPASASPHGLRGCLLAADWTQSAVRLDTAQELSDD